MKKEISNLLPYNYIAIEGNIGAGKTSLSKIIANRYNAKLVLEEFAENTFLPQFYENPERFAFPLEMSFLAERYQQLLAVQQEHKKEGGLLISDYIFEKSLLFASVNLANNELDLFNRFFSLIATSLEKPDLILFLKKSTSTLLKNIDKRGREYEKNIPSDYLQKITSKYINYLETSSNTVILIVESDEIDFIHNPQHLLFLINLIENKRANGVYHIKLSLGLES